MKENKLITSLKEILPGFLVALGVAIIDINYANFIPHVGAGTIAIFLGIIVGNYSLTKKYFKKDINFQKQIYYHI